MHVVKISSNLTVKLDEILELKFSRSLKSTSQIFNV
jgi:hypothetical protein